MKRAIHAYAAVLASLPITVLAQDAVQWRIEDGGNGHWYAHVDLWPPQPMWYQAVNNALAAGGHLATIASGDEQAFVWSIMQPGACGCCPWLGGYRPGDEWVWITGEPWTFSNWAPGQPDNQMGNQYVLEMSPATCDGRWSDVADFAFRSSIIEWDADCNGDGIVDYGQILDGTFEDLDGNGVPDCCDSGEFCGDCRVDLTEDGEVNTLDFLLFLGAWSQRDPLADWDGNGVVNTLDFLAFLNEWSAGC